ncbi:hypothetical protein [Lentzea sp. NPDC059081]|uniref:hypothetical protein n=1 Tax=Lentzea sp. NPDC059081 TaxID=3346719 RepID=UPI0036CF735D
MTGYGARHPELVRLVDACAPVAVAEVSWLDGAMPLRVSAYAAAAELPDELITSVRCVVRVASWSSSDWTNTDGYELL